MRSFIKLTAIFVILLLPIGALAAIAFDAATAGATGSANQSSLTYSHTTGGSLSNSVLVVFVGYFNRTVSVSTITYNGVNLTLRLRYENGTAAATNEVWKLANPASGANNVVITMSAAVGTGNYIVSGALTFSGVDQATPIEADNGGNVVTGAHTSHSSSVTTISDNAWAVSGILISTQDPTVTGSATERTHAIGSTDIYDTSTLGPITPPASQSMGWTFTSTSTATNLIVIALKPSGPFIRSTPRREGF